MMVCLCYYSFPSGKISNFGSASRENIKFRGIVFGEILWELNIIASFKRVFVL